MQRSQGELITARLRKTMRMMAVSPLKESPPSTWNEPNGLCFPLVILEL